MTLSVNIVSQTDFFLCSQLRDTVVGHLTEVKLTNLDNFALVTKGLAQVSSSEEEIEVELQVRRPLVVL